MTQQGGPPVRGIEECTGVEELSHETGRQLVDRDHQVTTCQAVALAGADVHQRVTADLIERQLGTPIGAHALQIAQELVHDRLGVLGGGEALRDIAEVELRHDGFSQGSPDEGVAPRWTQAMCRVARAIRDGPDAC